MTLSRNSSVGRRRALVAGLAAVALLSGSVARADDAPDISPELAKAKAEAEAQKAIAEAKKATVEAEVAGATAVSEKIPKSDIAGGVKLGEKAGKAEAYLMSAKAVSAAAGAIADAAPATCSRIAVFAGADSLSMGHWRVYETRRLLIEQAFDRAKRAFAGAEAARVEFEKQAKAKEKNKGGANLFEFMAPAPLALSPLLGFATTIEAVAKIGSFLQTEYEVSGVDIEADDVLLRETTSGALAARGKSPTQPLRLVREAVFETLTRGLVALDAKAADAAADYGQAQALAKSLRATKKPAAIKVAEDYERAAALAKSATESHAAFLGYISGADSGGSPNIQPVLADLAAKTVLFGPSTDGSSKACALALKVNLMGGGLYTKRNLWTFLGTMPFYVGGAATVTYTYIDPATGDVLASGAVQRHGGYDKLDRIAKSFGG